MVASSTVNTCCEQVVVPWPEYPLFPNNANIHVVECYLPRKRSKVLITEHRLDLNPVLQRSQTSRACASIYTKYSENPVRVVIRGRGVQADRMPPFRVMGTF